MTRPGDAAAAPEAGPRRRGSGRQFGFAHDHPDDLLPRSPPTMNPDEVPRNPSPRDDLAPGPRVDLDDLWDGAGRPKGRSPRSWRPLDPRPGRRRSLRRPAGRRARGDLPRPRRPQGPRPGRRRGRGGLRGHARPRGSSRPASTRWISTTSPTFAGSSTTEARRKAEAELEREAVSHAAQRHRPGARGRRRPLGRPRRQAGRPPAARCTPVGLPGPRVLGLRIEGVGLPVGQARTLALPRMPEALTAERAS